MHPHRDQGMSAATYISKAPELTPSTAFLELVQPDLVAIEDRLNREIVSDVRTVYSLSGHVLTAGGKRLRPAMVALSAKAVNPDTDAARIETVGASVELVHMATLVHDDVVDDTATRRGKPTANAVFGNGIAVLTGDYLLAKAMRLLAMDGDLRVIRTVSDITIEMSEGEVMELSATGDPKLSLSIYFEILRKKTAVFVEGCCRSGAIIAGAPPEQESALARYGYHLGMAFQIADDLLDYSGDPVVTGKPVGTDLKDGRATLPFLRALEQRVEAARLIQRFGDPDTPDGEIAQLVKAMESSGVFEHCREVATRHVTEAAESLALLPESPARSCFAALTNFVVARDR